MSNSNYKNKNNMVVFRLNEADYETLKNKSKHYKNLSDYLRSLIDDDRPVSENVEIKNILIKNQYYLNKIGNNINQIVKNNNSNFYNETDKENLLKLLEYLNLNFKKIIIELSK